LVLIEFCVENEIVALVMADTLASATTSDVVLVNPADVSMTGAEFDLVENNIFEGLLGGKGPKPMKAVVEAKPAFLMMFKPVSVIVFMPCTNVSGIETGRTEIILSVTKVNKTLVVPMKKIES